MNPPDWTRDWSKAGTEDIADAVSVLANSLGGVEQAVLEEASELLWQFADLKDNPEATL